MTQPELPTTATVHPPLTIIDPPPPPKPLEGAQSEERPPGDGNSAGASVDKPKESATTSAPAPTTTQAPVATAPVGVVVPPKELPFEAENATQATRLARMLIGSKLLSDGIQNESDISYLIMWGRQWNLPTIACLQVHIIKGKPTLPAAHIVGIIKNSPLCFEFECVETSARAAKWVTRRIGRDGMPGRELSLTYTIEEAEQMGLVGKGRTEERAGRNQWHTQPNVMLRWRAATALARLVYPDLLLGLHSTEEMIDALDIGGASVETIQVTHAELRDAKRGSPIDLSEADGQNQLPESTDTTPPEMRQAFNRPPAERQSEPVRRGGTSSRVAEKAAAARQQGASDPKACTHCLVPVIRPGLCDACKS